MVFKIDCLTPAQSQMFLAQQMLTHGVPVQRNTWQSTTAPSPAHELSNVVLEVIVPDSKHLWQATCEPDLPWSETHFQERVSGEPLNPPPSFIDWPWHSKEEATRFINKGGRFDHTYPERYWPKHVYPYSTYDVGDLDDIAALLRKDIWTRQAYLPVWFPEDTGSNNGQRVPCSLGYHFIRNGPQLDCNYFIRSCDLTRHYKNDVYLTGRLLQWVVDKITKQGLPYPGKLTVFISNLHLFTSDEWRFK